MNTTATAAPVTVVVRRIARPGMEQAFETAMREFIAESMTFPGSLDFHVMRLGEPSTREYLIVHRFIDAASRSAFTQAPNYRQWMTRLRELTESDPILQELGGISSWFTLPGKTVHKPPARWKMALVTFLGVYPLTSLLPQFFSGLLPDWPPLLTNVLTTGSIVALLTWAIMPVLTRAFAAWLFRVAR